MHTRHLAPGSPGYPRELEELVRAGHDAEVKGPPALFLRGELPTRPGVAIVGSREPPADALGFASRLARELGERGVALWSGGARGIDAAVHEAALAVGAPTAVVLPSGPGSPYPPEHEALFERVVERGGAVLSLWPDGSPFLPGRFLQRNRVLAVMTRATIVACAKVRSGARGAAAAARRVGRPVGAVPYPSFGPYPGAAEELALGAFAVTRVEHVLRVLGPDAPGPGPGPRESSEARVRDRAARPGARTPGGVRAEAPMQLELIQQLGELERALVGLLRGPARHLDELCEATGRGFPEVSRAVLTLTLAAIVVEGPPGFFRTPTAPGGVPGR
ncbi:MAG: DNA-processing protein DprA [Myxococcales bacterium]|nr:DNA-processing protein DprA [Myxococcales bacterium]